MKKRRPPKDEIAKLYMMGLTQREIGEKFGWTQSGISQLMKEYGIPTRAYKKWTQKEEEIVKKYYLKIPKEQLLALLPNRSWEAIKLKALQLGVARKKEEVRRSKEVIERLRKLAASRMIKPKFERKKELAYVLGVLDGDGYTDKKWTIGLETVTKEFAEKFTKSLRKLGLNANMKFNNKRKKWMVWASSKLLVQWYLSLSNDKKLSWLIKNKVAWEYLNGLYDSDGYLTPSGSPIICGYDIEKNKFISRLLTKLGVSNTVHKDRVYISAISTKKFFTYVKSVIKHRNPKWLKYTG